MDILENDALNRGQVTETFGLLFREANTSFVDTLYGGMITGIIRFTNIEGLKWKLRSNLSPARK